MPTLETERKEEAPRGIYKSGSESSFESVRDIDKKYLEKARIQIDEGSLPTNVSFEEFSEHLIDIADFQEKIEGEKRHIEIAIETDKPIAIAFLSDVHAGSAYTDYRLLEETGKVIKEHPLAFCITAGDLTDSLYFAYGDEILNMQGQYVYMNKLLRWIGPENILAGICGNHENWASKSGVNNYIEFTNNTQRPLLHGVSFIDLKVGAVVYKLLVSHRFRGSSYLNPTHQEGRANREIPGADIVMAAHTHEPGEQNIYPSKYGGDGEKVVLVNGKTFQKTSSYGKDQGFKTTPKSAMGCNWIILNNDRKMVRVMSNTDEMLETMSSYL